MCAGCVEVIRAYFPDITPETNLGMGSDHPASEILWSSTAFPFCEPARLDRQLADFFYYSALGISLCAYCGRPSTLGDGVVHIGATCMEFAGQGSGCFAMEAAK